MTQNETPASEHVLHEALLRGPSGLGGLPSSTASNPSTTVADLAARLGMSTVELRERILVPKAVGALPAPARRSIVTLQDATWAPVSTSDLDTNAWLRRQQARHDARAAFVTYQRREEASRQQAEIGRREVRRAVDGNLAGTASGLSLVPRRHLLWIGGHSSGAPRFDTEAAVIRDSLPRRYWHVDEHQSLPLIDWATELDDHDPDVLHISAHASVGGVHLADPLDPAACLPAAPDDVAKTLQHALTVPTLIVLNWCGSATTAGAIIRRLGWDIVPPDPSVTVVSWDAMTNDDGCARLSACLYRQLDHAPTAAEALTRTRDALGGNVEGLRCWPHDDRT